MTSASGDRQMTAQDWGLLTFLSLLWGCTFLFVGIAVKEVPPFTLVFLRVFIAALILLVVIRVAGIALPRGWAEWQPFVVLSILNNVIPFSLIAIGQQYVPSGLASIINATTPLFSLLVAWALAGEAIAGNKLVGVLVGIVGVAILLGPDLSALGLGAVTLGMLSCLGAALAYGTSAFWSRRLRGEPPLKLATAQLMVSSAIMFVLAAAFDRSWTLPMPSTPAVIAILGSATISTALAYLVFFRIIVQSGPQNANLVTLLIPPSAILLGAVFLGERLQLRQLIGAAVIGLALVVIDGRLFTKRSTAT
jgi:drug/metabolite transporter (DMT)-like permease